MSKKKKVDQSCSSGLEKLKRGNAKHVRQIKKQKGRLAKPIGVAKPGQAPYAAILSCADSRVIPERVFSAGEGELFVVRVAGNIANTSSIASLEYAVEYLNVRIIVVLGHESCGAVESAIAQANNRLDFGENLNALLAHIVPAINVLPVKDVPAGANKKPVNDLKTGVKKNARHSAEQLIAQSEILRGYYDDGLLGIFNGYYNIYGKKPGKVSGMDDWSCPKS